MDLQICEVVVVQASAFEVLIHKDFDACMAALPGARVFAFTTHTDKCHA